MIEPATALVGLRAISTAAAALLFGGFSMLAQRRSVLRSVLESGLMPALRSAAMALLLATAAMIPVLAADSGDGWADVLNFSKLHDLAFSTRSGNAVLVRICIAALLFYCIWSWKWMTSFRLYTATVLPGLYIASFAFTGHAMLHEGILGLLHQLNHIVHVLAGSFWIGALLPLLAASSYLDNPVLRPEALSMLDRFSFAGAVAVTLIAATGAVNTALILGKLPLDRSSAYQSLLLAKIALVILMIVLAGTNRWWLLPRARLMRRNPALPLSIAAECFAGFCVIVLVAVFGMMEPV